MIIVIMINIIITTSIIIMMMIIIITIIYIYMYNIYQVKYLNVFGTLGTVAQDFECQVRSQAAKLRSRSAFSGC